MPPQLYERLFEYSKPFQAGKLGPSIQEIGKIPITADLVSDLTAAIRSPNSSDRNVALFFCEGLLACNPEHRDLLSALVPLVNDLITSTDDLARSSVVPVFIRLRGWFPNYRKEMLELLTNPNSNSRADVLQAAETFLRKREIQPLLSFQNDPVISETGGMGGPWRYILRDEALRLIEKMLGRSFRTQECTEAKDNQVIFWWDWRPFLEWRSTQKH